VTIGVGRTVPGLTQLAHSYQMASDAANLKLYLGKNQIITMDTLEPSQNYDIIMDAKESDKLVTLLKAADHIKIIHWLETLFMDITNRKRLNLNQCQRICLQILMSSSNVGMQLDLYTTHFPIEQENLIWEKLLRLETVDEMKQMLADHLGSLCSEINNKRNEKSSNVVELVKSIIHNNIHINWSLSEIASQIYLTSTYICILFKQETGDTINEYMTRVKMEKAKDMLQDHRFKLYEIGLAVGYTDSSYFAKLFKKYTGLAPSEYRNTIR
jgi:two-component system response regulator YesN